MTARPASPEGSVELSLLPEQPPDFLKASPLDGASPRASTADVGFHVTVSSGRARVFLFPGAGGDGGRDQTPHSAAECVGSLDCALFVCDEDGCVPETASVAGPHRREVNPSPWVVASCEELDVFTESLVLGIEAESGSETLQISVYYSDRVPGSTKVRPLVHACVANRVCSGER